MSRLGSMGCNYLEGYKGGFSVMFRGFYCIVNNLAFRWPKPLFFMVLGSWFKNCC